MAKLPSEHKTKQLISVWAGSAGGFDQVTQVVQPNLTAEVPQQDQKLLPGLAELCPLTNFD